MSAHTHVLGVSCCFTCCGLAGRRSSALCATNPTWCVLRHRFGTVQSSPPRALCFAWCLVRVSGVVEPACHAAACVGARVCSTIISTLVSSYSNHLQYSCGPKRLV